MKRLPPLFFSSLMATGFCALSQPPSAFAQEAPIALNSQEKRSNSTKQKIKPYDRVITKDATTDEGIFTVHKIGGKYYYEIPRRELGKEFLWVTHVARASLGPNYGGTMLDNRVVKWDRHGEQVLLRKVEYDIVANKDLPIARAVRAANNDAIIMAFNIEAFGKDDSVVIDVTRLFSTEVIEFSARGLLRAHGFDPRRSFIERATSFPKNIEVQSSHTFTSNPESGPTNPAGQPPGMRPGSATVLMHYSMIRLPEKPMMPRLFDERVGYYPMRQFDYGREEHRAERRTYITRWRLEKKDPSSIVTEPINPIVYYVDPATPAKWIPYIKQGVEQWQGAFEAAGFKNAIVAKDPPPTDVDPHWSPEDARYSVVRWLASSVERAVGPRVIDPRSGEILEADIMMHHNVMNRLSAMYFTQVGALDPRARKLPLPDEVMGKMLEYVVAHEVGHTLGFQHNMKASSMYAVENVRDREWVRKMGHTPTLMDYSRFNYVAQPEDKIDVKDLIPKVGPYDKWATMWGYKPIPGAKTPDDEKKTLDDWARQQDSIPWLRFSTSKARGSDPGDLAEAVGDADAVVATGLGLKNLQRVADMMLEAASQPGEPYYDLEQVYGQLFRQWSWELNHVVAIVGGFYSQQKHGGQDGVLFIPVLKERQVQAVRFLNEHAFKTPNWALRQEILRRIEPTGGLDRVKAVQEQILASLFDNDRVGRLVEQVALDGDVAYHPVDFFADVRRGVWRELDDAVVRIDTYRGNLQRAYLDIMSYKLNGPTPATGEPRALMRGELRTLDMALRRARVRSRDEATRSHLDDSHDTITRALDPRFMPAGPVAASVAVKQSSSGDKGDPHHEAGLTYWPD